MVSDIQFEGKERRIDKIDHTALHIGENVLSILEIDEGLEINRTGNNQMAEMLKKLGFLTEDGKGVINEDASSPDGTDEPR